MATHSERFAQEVFEGFGFSVERIPEAESKTPDFLVSDERYRYLVEVKEKLTDPRRLKERDAALAEGHPYEQHEGIAPKSRISRTVHDGSKQLVAGSGSAADFRLIWLQALGTRPDAQIDQFRYTLYGIRDLFDLKDKTSRECVF